ncbi:MAG: helix-turn-helix domain-containing protein [Pseudomonadota bacterium]
MARPRQFNPDEALDSVVEVFWRRGYAATGYDELVRASGVSRKSLYATFGDKDALFIAALRRYRATVAQSILDDLAKTGGTPGSTGAVLAEIGKAVALLGQGRGCLMANTAAAEATASATAQKEVHDHLEAQRAAFTAALRREGLSARRAKRLGHFATGTLQAIFLLGHASADRAYIDALVAEAKRTLVDR